MDFGNACLAFAVLCALIGFAVGIGAVFRAHLDD